MEAMFKWHGTHQLPNGPQLVPSTRHWHQHATWFSAVPSWGPYRSPPGSHFSSVWDGLDVLYGKKNMLIKCLGNFWIWKIEHPKRNSCLFIQQPYNYWKMMEGKCYAGFGQCQKHHPVVSVAWLCKKNCFLIFLVKWTVSLMMHSRCIKKTKYIYIYIYQYIRENADWLLISLVVFVQLGVLWHPLHLSSGRRGRCSTHAEETSSHAWPTSNTCRGQCRHLLSGNLSKPQKLWNILKKFSIPQMQN